MDGAQERVDSELKRTGKVSGFVGYWHTHPGGRAYPSPTDEQGMASIVRPDGRRTRALMLIFAGNEERWSNWRDGSAGSEPEIFARVVPRSASLVAAGHPGFAGGQDLQHLPPGSYFRGGYSGADRTERSSGAASLGMSSERVRMRWWSPRLWRLR
ncbi:Mov34/MPN/PAD-1 family protein [Kribbella sp. NPDC050820]|uniref:Mov34/MPN/PAD-1 family protein n=1 Tax=Kribbella sp. NPDC050820 TaxID=3155408 RepID=UPI0034012235